MKNLLKRRCTHGGCLTANRVLRANDYTHLKIPISLETRQKVMQAIAEFGYEPNARAKDSL